MPFYTDSDTWAAYSGDAWAQQAHGQVADQWAAQATADAPDRAAAAEQQQAQAQAASQAQAQAEAQRQAAEQAQQQAAAAAQVQQQQQQANNWAANQWSNQAYSQAASASSGVTPPPKVADTPVDSSSGLPSGAAGGYVGYAYQAAQNAGIDPNIFVKQINQESGFNPNAKSPAGATGIAQFMPATAQGLGIDPTNPLAALDGAAKLMASYVQKYSGDYGKALSAYNAGPGNVDKFGGIPPFAETQTYVKNILGSAGQTVQDIAAKAGGAVQQLIQAPQQTAQDLLSKVQPFLGNAYVWGGKGPQQGFDCSGLAGFLTTGQAESTTTLYGKSSTITPDTAQPGDLVFWNMGSNDPHMQHVAVYMGNGQIVQSGGNQSAVNIGSVGQQIGSAPEFRRLGQGGAPAQANAPAGAPPPNAPPQQSQSVTDFIQQTQANQGRMPTDTELGNFYLSQPPVQQTAAAVGQPQPLQQPTSPFDVVGKTISGLGSAVSGAVSGMGNALGGLFGGGGPGGQPLQGPTETAPGATTSPFAGLPALPTGMPPEGGGYGAGGPLLPGEATSALAPIGEAVTGLAQNPLMPTNLTNAGLQALGQNVVAPGLEAIGQPGGALIGPRTAAAQALEGLAGQVPSGVPVIGGALQGAAAMVGGPTPIDAAQTASQIEQKYGGGLQTTPDGRQVWRPPDYSRITPEDQAAMSNAMWVIGSIEGGPEIEGAAAAFGRTGGTAAERAAAEAGGAARQAPVLSTRESNFLQSHTLVPTSDPRPLGPSQPGLPNVKAVMQQNLAEVLPGDATLYHETSLPNARAILQRVEAGPRNQSGIWASDNRDLALGQGGKGVTLEFDPALVNGGAGENPAKAFSAQAGMGTEYQVDKTLRGAVQAIVANTQRQADQLAADPLIASRFDFAAAQQTPEGIRIPYAGPSRTPVASAEIPSAAPVSAAEPTAVAGAPAISPPMSVGGGEATAPVSGAPGGNLPTAAGDGVGEPPIRPPTAVGAPPPPEPQPEPGLLNRLTQGQPEQAGNITLSKYPEDVRQVITDAANSLPDQMKAATRGVLPDQAVRDLSQQTGIDVDQIVRNWNPGQAQNAETLLALRDALTAQARNVIDAQQALRAAPDSAAAQGDLLQALTQHAAIQEVVSGSTAEAGRALRQFRQAVPGSDFATNQINQMAARSGMTPEEMASALGRVDLSDPAAVAQLARSLPQGPPTLDEIFKTYHTNNVISGLPTLTHVAVNSILAPAWSFTTRSLADLAGLNFDRVQGGGIGFGAGLAHAGEDFLTGFRDVLNNPASVANRLGGAGGAALKAQGVFGALHGAFQNVAQGIIERTEIGRLAGEAATDQGLRGAAWTKFVADALDNPAADMVQQARGVAQRAALRGELGTLGQKMQQIANVPFVGNTLFPVVKISTNALTQGIERSPLGLLGTGFDVARAASGAGPYAKGFEPLTGAVTPLSERLTNNLAGTAVTAFLVNKGLDGTITGDGPSDPKERAALMSQGWQANSVWVPGRGYVDYRVLGPIAQDFALVGNYADAEEEVRRHPGQATLGQNALEIAGNLAQRQASYMGDATGLRTLGQIYEVLHGGANAANVAAQIFGQTAGGFVPESAAVRGLVSAADPYARQPQKGDIGEVIAQGLPGGTPGIGGRTDLPVRLNELGQPEANPQVGLGIFVPRTGMGTVSPVMTLLGSEGLSPPSAPKTVRAGQQDITLTPDEQRQYQQLRGALLEQMMMPLTQNQQFAQAPGPARKQVLQRLMARADQVAQRQLIGAIAQTGDLVSRLGPGPRQQEPVPFRPPLPLNELAPITPTAAAPSRAPLPLTSDLATLGPAEQDLRRELAGTP